MLPGLSSVLRRDKERQRAAAALNQDLGQTSPSSSQNPVLGQSGSLQREGSSGSTSSATRTRVQTGHNTIGSPKAVPNAPSVQQQQQYSQQQQTAAGQQTTSPRGGGAGLQYSMLPEEHRAREKEKIAKAQLGNAHTQQKLANRNMAQSLSPTNQQAMQEQTRYSSQHMESSVTRLLVATKMLLESLTKWSLGQKTETQVSDIYVRLGNDFNVANVAFGSYGIDMSDLHSVPDDLRACLERCLSEDPSPQTLEIHLPQIREIIIGLLQGLKAKQAEYKQYLVQSRASARQSRSRNERVGASEEVPASYSSLPPSAASNASTSAMSPESVKRTSSLGTSLTPQSPVDHERKSILVQAAKRPTQAPPLDLGNAAYGAASGSSSPVTRQASSSSLRTHTGADVEEETTSSTPVKRNKKSLSGRSNRSKTTSENSSEDGNHRAPFESQRLVDDGIQRHSLSDNGPSASADIDDARTPTIASTSFSNAQAQREPNQSMNSSFVQSNSQHGSLYNPDGVGELGDAADPSVRALKSRDALERRASKRFSAYTFNKMGVGLNQGMGMSSYALSGMGGTGSGSASQSPMMDRKEGGGKMGRGSRSGFSRASSDTPESVRDYYSPMNRKAHKGRMLSSEDVMEESRSTEFAAGMETPSRRPTSTRTLSKSSTTDSPRGGSMLKLAPPIITSGTASLATSSTESLPFLDAASPDGDLSPQAAIANLPSARSSGVVVPPVPPLPSPEERARLDGVQCTNRSSSSTSKPVHDTPSVASTSSASADQPLPSLVDLATPTTLNGHAHTQQSESSSSATSMMLFLQLGRQTRKSNVEIVPGAPVNGLNIGKLRMLFMDRFSYSPGKEDFPAIYLKDASSGVTYELEDLNDVGEGSILTLNIEPLDQVKQHLDLSLSAISRELRELKTAVFERDTSRKISAARFQSPDPLSSPPPTKISDAQFAMAGAKVAQYKRATMMHRDGAAGLEEAATPIMSPSIKSSTGGGGGGGGGANWRMAGDQIKQQYDEVQKVRRQLAIINQIQAEFKTEVGGLLGSLREQTSKVRSIAASEVPTERNFIIAGKARLDASSQEILTLVEDLLDGVDDLKNDVIQRGVKPKPNTMKQLHADIARATKGLEDLSTYVSTVKPSWKKTWELELQNIVDEQEFLNHQEGLIADLKEDHYSLQEVFQNIQEVVKLRGANKFTMTSGTGGGSGSESFLGGVALRQYVPPAPEEGHEGLSTVMMEVKSQSVDHEKRLKALQAAERQRQKEMSQRKGKEDEFQQELTTFVDGRVLRKTGGYMETERVRSRRDKLTIQAMFSGGTNLVGGAPSASAMTPRGQTAEGEEGTPNEEF